VTVDGSKIGELGPGAIAGERSVLEESHRTATLAAITNCVVAVATETKIDLDKLAGLAEGPHREDPNE
jgi:CRP-like cAMP-binding protein